VYGSNSTHGLNSFFAILYTKRVTVSLSRRKQRKKSSHSVFSLVGMGLAPIRFP
jgi:hypothetical protein